VGLDRKRMDRATPNRRSAPAIQYQVKGLTKLWPPISNLCTSMPIRPTSKLRFLNDNERDH